jgi:hypothetical protein
VNSCGLSQRAANQRDFERRQPGWRGSQLPYERLRLHVAPAAGHMAEATYGALKRIGHGFSRSCDAWERLNYL